MKTLIIEDEKAALRNLKAVMQEVDTDFEIVGEVDSIFDGVEWFRTHPMPELVFMDIHLADGSAFDICAPSAISLPPGSTIKAACVSLSPLITVPGSMVNTDPVPT